MARVTFGVELEAMYFYTDNPQHLGFPDDKDKGLAPIIDMSSAAMQYRDLEDQEDYPLDEHMQTEMIKHVERTILNFVAKLPETSRGEVVYFEDEKSQGDYQTWMVVIDDSIMPESSYKPLSWAPLEVVSPAMYVSEGAFREVQAVVNMIRDTFRTAVPPSCGLHVHVGMGAQLFPVETLKRLGALCWAADLLLGQMHPLARQRNDFCLGVRYWSVLADIMKDSSDKTSKLHEDVNPNEGDTHNKHEMVHVQPRRLATEFNRTFARDMHATEICEELEAGNNIFFSTNFDTPPTLEVGILEGVRRISVCKDWDSVANLLSICGRGAYNFRNYSDFARYHEECTKNTVEFRQAAGSLDGLWVATYARIVAGIAQFARTADSDTFSRLVHDCHDGETNNIGYDILDLLIDLGLTEEAKIVQCRLETRSHVAEMLRNFSANTTLLPAYHYQAHGYPPEPEVLHGRGEDE
ncbi:hypothetical protein M426DRAFT_8398 [Hypoxylon sp. CI-4A]|nr:hypothetical protein M426DRAFT_8398 [Hypoxylon sp. CI-4A]